MQKERAIDLALKHIQGSGQASFRVARVEYFLKGHGQVGDISRNRWRVEFWGENYVLIDDETEEAMRWYWTPPEVRND